jgi:predicted DNA-binding transcriptional regulator AlpA
VPLSLTLVSHRIRTADDPAFLTVGQVKLRYGGVSDMWITRHIKDHGMPPGIKLGGPTSARHWRLTDLEKWEAEREAKS